jgi:hypothetical protein
MHPLEPTLRLFTVDEANTLIPSLALRFGRMALLRATLGELFTALERLGEVLDVRSFDQPQVGRTPEAVELRSRLRRELEQLSEELDAVAALGVAVKDVELGLCDFRGEVDGQEVWLCWQYGEPAVGFYHPLDAGFGARRPLPGVEADGPTRRLVH